MSGSPPAGDYAAHPVAGRAARVMVRGNTRSTLFVAPAPPYAVSGAGSLVTDQFGHQVVDANNNYTSLLHGHGRPEVGQAVEGLLRTGTAFGLPTESEVQLAELLAARTGHERWRFSNSGTEAVMTAVRAARAFTGRALLVRFAGSYHGTADAVVPIGAPGITDGVRSEVVELPQGDREAFDRLLDDRGRQVAAVLVDLMPNRTGLVPADPGFVEHLRARTRAVGALLVVDEVISFRIAAGGLASAYGIRPDLVAVGKVVGGGFPVGAVGGRADVLGVFDPAVGGSVGWGGTFSANPVTMTAGRVAVELFDEAAISALNHRGDQLRQALHAAGVRVSGRGSLLRVTEQVDPAALWWAAYRRGAMLGTNGLVALATSMTDDQVAVLEAAVVDAVAAVRQGLG